MKKTLLFTMICVLGLCNSLFADNSRSIENLYVSPTGWVMWTENNAESVLKYQIYLNGELENESLMVPYYQHENLTVGTEYTTKVVANYSDGANAEMEYTWTNISNEEFEGATNFSAEYVDDAVELSWSMPEIEEGPEGIVLSYDFETDSQGWTTINANEDDHTWFHSEEIINHGVTSNYAGYDGSVGFMFSESYHNPTGAVLTPDDYLVTPEKIMAMASSTITFWACSQDENYPAEHFGVAVSTAGNTSAADFTTIAEWTLTAKGAKGVGERSSKDPGKWYQFEVDLGEYADQEIWVAIRHFNCSDQFILLVDDVVMTKADPNAGEEEEVVEPLGAMLFRNGELVTNEPIQDTVFVDEDGIPTDEYCVRVVYGGEEDVTYYAMSEAVCVEMEYTIYCEAPTGLDAQYDQNEDGTFGVIVSYNAEDSFVQDDAFDHYNIYRSTTNGDYQLIAETDEEEYADVLTEEGTYYYQVTAVYAEFGEECESEPATTSDNQNYVVVETVSLDENADNVMTVYPNPTYSCLNIAADSMTHVAIYNMSGQLVYDNSVAEDNVTVDMSQYESGTYMVRITTENGVAVERVTVVK